MDDYLLYIKTVQSQSIKILIESLKEVLTDINLYFDNIYKDYNKAPIFLEDINYDK